MKPSGAQQFVRICYWVGFAADALAILPLLFPTIAEAMFGLQGSNLEDNEAFLYVSRIGASLMLGWALLLLWGSFHPVERRGMLLLTAVPVLLGLLAASILAVTSGFIALRFLAPLWVFYGIMIPAYVVAYRMAAVLPVSDRASPSNP
jgi:hypothetical protein